MLLRNQMQKAVVMNVLPIVLVLGFAVVLVPYGRAQSQQSSDHSSKIAVLHGPPPAGEANSATTASAPADGGAAPAPEIAPAVARELAAMKAEIEELRAELKKRNPEDNAGPAGPPAAAMDAATPEPAPDPVSRSLIRRSSPRARPMMQRQNRTRRLSRKRRLLMPTGLG
jgi:hypothetical protein